MSTTSSYWKQSPFSFSCIVLSEDELDVLRNFSFAPLQISPGFSSDLAVAVDVDFTSLHFETPKGPLMRFPVVSREGFNGSMR